MGNPEGSALAIISTKRTPRTGPRASTSRAPVIFPGTRHAAAPLFGDRLSGDGIALYSAVAAEVTCIIASTLSHAQAIPDMEIKVTN